ncbi:hypothetical protein V5O48_013548 [Marasmius crinis-equi]|uniref:Ribosome biogenesis protein SLX9 n=1 Tax=Marasmius crinis-equi TaxID=585013 RepID=A0ABR3EZR6_9AGAR
MSVSAKMTPLTSPKTTVPKSKKKKVLDLSLLTMEDLEIPNTTSITSQQVVVAFDSKEPSEQPRKSRSKKKKVLDASKLDMAIEKTLKPKKKKALKAKWRLKYPEAAAEYAKSLSLPRPPRRILSIQPKLIARVQRAETTLPSESSSYPARTSSVHTPKISSPLSQPTRNMVRVLSVQMERQLSSGWHVTEIVLI